MSKECCCGENCNCSDNFKELKPILDEYAKVEGSLITILQKAQEIYGYLSLETINYISEKTGIKPAKIYGVATFYSQFRLNPIGKYLIGVCMGTACYVKNSQSVVEALEKELKIKSGETTEDFKFTLESTRCLGCCGLAPVMMINDDVYGGLEAKDIPKILSELEAREVN